METHGYSFEVGVTSYRLLDTRLNGIPLEIRYKV